MQEVRKNQPREAREDLIDSLIAMSLLTRRMARLLDIQIHKNDTTTLKGEPYYGCYERTGRRAYRVVRTL